MILPPIPDIWLKRLLIVVLYRLPMGELTLITPERETWHFVGKAPGPLADATLHDWWVVKRLFFEGEGRFLEDQQTGKWETENLPAIVELVTLNRMAIKQRINHMWLVKLWRKLR